MWELGHRGRAWSYAQVREVRHWRRAVLLIGNKRAGEAFGPASVPNTLRLVLSEPCCSPQSSVLNHS